MIIAYSRKEYPDEGVRNDNHILTFMVAPKASTRLSDLKTGEEIWYRAMDSALVGSSVLNLYAKYQKMGDAIVVFDRTLRRDLVCLATMISGFAKSGMPIEAFNMYRQMQKEGVEGDGVVTAGLKQACANLGDLKLGLSVPGHLIQKDLLMNVAVQTGLWMCMPTMDI